MSKELYSKWYSGEELERERQKLKEIADDIDQQERSSYIFGVFMVIACLLLGIIGSIFLLLW